MDLQVGPDRYTGRGPGWTDELWRLARHVCSRRTCWPALCGEEPLAGSVDPCCHLDASCGRRTEVLLFFWHHPSRFSGRAHTSPTCCYGFWLAQGTLHGGNHRRMGI